jgi:hypothetical protein
MLPKQQHHAVLAHDFAAHDLVHMVLQGIDFARQVFDLVKRHHTDFSVLQGDGITGVVVIDDAVQADDLAGHLEAGDLVATVFGGDTGLEEPGADRIQRGEVLTVAEKGCPALDLAPYRDDFIDLVQIGRGQAHRHAKLAQIAVRTGNFDGLGGHAASFGLFPEAYLFHIGLGGG